jgi:hypothetical protein
MIKKEADQKFYWNRIDQTTRQLIRYVRTLMECRATTEKALTETIANLNIRLVKEQKGENKSQEPGEIVDLTPFIPDELLGTGIRGDSFSPIEENLKED